MMSHDLMPFWLDREAEEQKSDRIEKFMAEIYPIWGKELMRWEATFEDETCEPEVNVLHRIERSIHESGIRIYRGVKEKKESRDYKRQRLGNQYQQALSD